MDIDPDGKSIWVAERCGANSCYDRAKAPMSPLPVMLKFDDGEADAQLRHRHRGLPARHPRRPRRQHLGYRRPGQHPAPRSQCRADSPLPPAPAKVIGHQVFKFSPDGKLLITLGKPGGNQPGQPADPASFFQPNDVITYPNGDILVAEGHGNAPRPRRG